MIRFHWHLYGDQEMHSTDLELPSYTSEGEIKEMIRTSQGDRCLAQYINITRMERVNPNGPKGRS